MDPLRYLGPFAVLAATLTACGGGPVAPTPEGGVSARLALAGDPVVTLGPGQSVDLPVRESDSDGRPVTRLPEAYSWTSTEPGIISVRSGGTLTAGSALGYALITVRAPNGLTASVHGWVQPPESTPSTFRVTLQYGDGVPERWKTALEVAAERWARVIRRDLPDAPLEGAAASCRSESMPPLTGVERGVRVFVEVSTTFDPTASVEAVGGPCVQRPLPRPTTILGRIALNAHKLVEPIGASRLQYVATHEMGHTLGLVAVVQGVQPSWFDPPPRNAYKGPLGLEGYRREFGVAVSELTVAGGHWSFTGDIMGTTVHRISQASVGALMDLGYPAAWYGAH